MKDHSPLEAPATKTYDAYDADRPLLMRCACGGDHAPGEHAQAARVAVQSEEETGRDFVEAKLQERDQRTGEQRRQHERNGDAPRGVPGLAAKDRRCVLEIAGGSVERVRDQHEHIGERVAGDHED